MFLYEHLLVRGNPLMAFIATLSSLDLKESSTTWNIIYNSTKQSKIYVLRQNSLQKQPVCLVKSRFKAQPGHEVDAKLCRKTSQFLTNGSVFTVHNLKEGDFSSLKISHKKNNSFLFKFVVRMKWKIKQWKFQERLLEILYVFPSCHHKWGRVGVTFLCIPRGRK